MTMMIMMAMTKMMKMWMMIIIMLFMIMMIVMMSYTISGEEKPACSVGFGQMGKSNMMRVVLNFYLFLYLSNNIFLETQFSDICLDFLFTYFHIHQMIYLEGANRLNVGVLTRLCDPSC